MATALLLADARTPTGSHAHSAGVEAAALSVADVPGFLRGRLRTVAFTEAAIAARAVRATTVAELLVLDGEARARCPSPALREASTSLGRGVLRTGAALFGAGGLPAAYRSATSWSPRPVAFGVVAAAGGLTPHQAALVSLHDDAASVAAAAVKLLPVDAAVACGWVAAAAAELESLADEAAAAAVLPSRSAPLVDARSLLHAHSPRRLFAS